MALYILREAYRNGRIQPGDTIAEATSGNTGISFAAIGRALGHPVRIFMPDWMSRERQGLIRSYGAEIVLVSAEQGGFLGSIRLSEEFAASRTDVFLPCQFSNAANAEAHEATTGPEIWAQLESVGVYPDAFVAGVGTGGTVMGVGRCLRAHNPAIENSSRRSRPSLPPSPPGTKWANTVSRASRMSSSRQFWTCLGLKSGDRYFGR